MKKLMRASLLLVILALLQTKVFAFSLDCKFKDNSSIAGIHSIQLTEDYLFINETMEIPLEKTQVNCGNFGKQVRFDGMALGYQVVLESCTTEAELEGLLVDSLKQQGADIECR